jgi:hypothetical protein
LRVLTHLALFAFSLAPVHTPYASAETLALGVIQAPPSVAQNGVEEAIIGAHGTYDNPFDPDDVSLDADVETPSGARYRIPGFFCRSYARALEGKTERLTPEGAGDWRVRICPNEPGSYTVLVRFKDRTGLTEKTFSFSSVSSSDHGLVEVSKQDRHYFAYGDGSPFFPVGANICWASSRGTYDYDEWLPKYGTQGCNYFRLWLAPSWTTFALEKPGSPEQGGGMGQFDLGDAWRLDRVLEEATQNGMYAMLCLDSYNELRDRDAANWWEKTPQNKDNGGPLRVMSDYWTSSEMDRLYLNKLRYLVARYSAYTHVFAWEFWNEVDVIRNFNPDQVREWHQRMGADLRALDPYHHLVTTSFSDSLGNRGIDLLPQLDYVQTHFYGPSLIGSIAYQQSRKSAWSKPHYVGEVGADSGGPRAKEDVQGVQVHDPQWVSLVTGAAGGAMPWWWDSLIEPNDLYPLFGAFHRFVDGIDFAKESFRPVDPTLSYSDPHTKAPPGDLILESGLVSWQPDDANAPQTILIKNGVLIGPTPSGLLHGIRNHKGLHNPLTIKFRSATPETLEIVIQEVSTYGGANLHVSVDGQRVVTREFETGDENKDPSLGHRYDGIIPVSIPAGSHQVVLDNTGADWIRIGYRLPNVVHRSSPPLAAWALAGNDMVLAWICQAGRNWQNVVIEKPGVPAVAATIIHLSGLARGTWKEEVWDTWKGTIVGTSKISVGIDGNASAPLPQISSDVALKLLRENN